MDKDEVDIIIILQEFYKLIKPLYSVKALLLYGSYAKGTYNKDSDIDVAVIIDETDYSKKINITATLFKISAKVDLRIEPKCIYLNDYLNCEPASILAEIKRSAKIVA